MKNTDGMLGNKEQRRIFGSKRQRNQQENAEK
jgi:hypothetical protein